MAQDKAGPQTADAQNLAERHFAVAETGVGRMVPVCAPSVQHGGAPQYAARPCTGKAMQEPGWATVDGSTHGIRFVSTRPASQLEMTTRTGSTTPYLRDPHTRSRDAVRFP
jgi:hypothetical protein